MKPNVANGTIVKQLISHLKRVLFSQSIETQRALASLKSEQLELEKQLKSTQAELHHFKEILYQLNHEIRSGGLLTKQVKLTQSACSFHALEYFRAQEIATLKVSPSEEQLRSMVPRDCRILDLPCGAGERARVLRGHVRSYLGADASALLIENARARLQAEVPSLIQFQQISSTWSSQLAANSFEFVLIAPDPGHWSRAQIERYIEIAASVLSPSGRILVRLPITREELKHSQWNLSSSLLESVECQNELSLEPDNFCDLHFRRIQSHDTSADLRERVLPR